MLANGDREGRGRGTIGTCAHWFANEISRIGFVSQTTKFSGHDFCWTWPALGVMRDHQSVPLFIRYPPISGKEARQCEKRCHHKQTHHRSQAPTRRRKKTTNDTAIKLIGAHWRCLRTVPRYVTFLDSSTKKTRQSLRATRDTDRSSTLQILFEKLRSNCLRLLWSLCRRSFSSSYWPSFSAYRSLSTEKSNRNIGIRHKHSRNSKHHHKNLDPIKPDTSEK